MDFTPTELVRKSDSLQIKWSDETVQTISLRLLRDSCPCATCIESSSGKDPEPVNPLQVLSVQQTVPLQIVSMKPVGNYAYNIEYSDGHNTGIYTFALLRRLNS